MDSWEIIKKYLKQNDKTHNYNKFLVQHHIKSYEIFIEKYIDEIISNYNPFVYKYENQEEYNIIYKFEFSKINFTKGTYMNNCGKTKYLTPNKARLKGENYEGNIYINITQTTWYETKDGIKITDKPVIKYRHNNILLCKMPIMVGSKYCITNYNKSFDIDIKKEECKYDNGGYFIIKGNEKIIVCQERMCDNKVFVFKNQKNKKVSHYSEIRSNSNISNFSQLTNILFNSHDGLKGLCTIHFKIPKLYDSIPVFAILKYFGAKSDLDIIKCIVGKKIDTYFKILEPSIKEWNDLKLNTREELINYLNKKLKSKYTIDKIENYEILPHLGQDRKSKLLYLGYMVKELLDVVLNRKKESDRDHFANKRIETTGILLSQLFYSSFKLFLDLNIKRNVKKSKNEVQDIFADFKKSNITKTLKFCLGTGNWNNGSKTSKKVGIAQVFNRITYSASLSHLRRINAPISKQAKIILPRKLHNSQQFYVCAVESPEGQCIGLLKNLTIVSTITHGFNPNIITEILIKYGIEDIRILDYEQMDDDNVKIFINGILIGIYEKDIHLLIEYMRNLRQQLIIPPDTSIYFDFEMNNLYFSTDVGRLIRPLFVIKNNKINNFKKYKTWREYLSNGVIEYIDVQETENCMIAMFPDDLKNKKINYTHLEINPSLIFGVCGSIIPFPEHNQSPRNIYEASMCKQAIGIPTSNFTKRMDTSNYLLLNPQKPIVYTQTAEILGLNDLPAGQNVVVAICSMFYNQEDSIILNKSSVERGLFHSLIYNTHKSEIDKNVGYNFKERFCIPTEDFCKYLISDNYSNIDKNGMAIKNKYVKEGDVIIGKISPINEKFKNDNNIKYKDSSIQISHNECGYIDNSIKTYNSESHDIIKVKLRKYLKPIVGDKVASRSAQKGIVGVILPECDLPYTKDGVVPDIVINSHSMPSRMTMSQILECVLSKLGTLKNEFVDGTAFNNKYDINKISTELQSFGYSNELGKEEMYDGETGEKLNCNVFIGPTFYQALKHLVSKKIHARSTGSVTKLTKQPTDGRNRNGGMRIGEMELNCLNSHGTSFFTKERMFECSDKYQTYICNKCNLIAECNEEKKIYKCIGCKNYTDFSKINLPYSTKLLMNELAPMNVMMRIKT